MNAPANTPNQPEVLSLNATLPNAKLMQLQADRTLETANEFVIDSDVMYGLAADELKEIKAKKDNLNKTRLSITRPMDEAKKRIMDLFKSPIDVLEKAEKTIEKAMLDYQAEKRRIAQEQQRQLEEAARQEQQRLQQIADEERQKAEEEKQKLQQEAEQAKSTGNLAQAAILEAQAENAVRQADMIASTIEASSEMSAAPVVIEEKVTTKGVSTVDNYQAEVTNKLALVKWVAQHPEDIDLLLVNAPELNKRAKHLREALNLPGVKVTNKPSIRRTRG
jgi:DNA repair exonuclease SbcCD ATPase subunit